MKKNVSYFALLAVCSAGLISCSNPVLKTKSINHADKYYILPKDTTKGSLNVSIQVELPDSYTNKDVLQKIRNSVVENVFGKEYVNLPDDSLATKFYGDLVADYKNNQYDAEEFSKINPHYTFNSEQNFEGYSLWNDQNIYSYGFNYRGYNAGDAHGLDEFLYFNYDLKTGNLITENDLFTDGYEPALTKLIKETIKADNNINDLDKSPFLVDSIKPNGNFFISDEGIIYVFNVYEIAPYYIGKTEVKLPYDKINDLLKPNSLIKYLADESKKTPK